MGDQSDGRRAPLDLVSPGGADGGLLELVIGFFVAVSLIAVITMVRRRRGGRRDLLGAQLREMQARAAAAASPEADTVLRAAATQIAAARSIAEAPSVAEVPSVAEARSVADATRAPAPGALSSAADATAAGRSAADATAAGRSAADATAAGRPAPDATAPPPVPVAEHDAMADTYAWLRIAALVEAGRRDQAVELLSTTMAVPADEAELLVDGLIDAGGERRPG
ncbi:hypothetical protein GCM10027087_31740 [Paractinoplanes abujensis]|uniref:Uncharacterized protein n=1 Tax=Paractinoplanes abujensis TaxID=882441 RepID=A0A7W7G2R6_9ACTN|nr:hypothetical protein [Actinoplanes abujensis]MBB4694102.1 hypothetical protein [Actinoplanes abujensis]